VGNSPKKPSAWLQRAQTWAEQAGQKLQGNAQELSGQLTETEAWGKVRSAADAARLKTQDAARAAQQKAQDAGVTAQKLIASLMHAPNDLDDPNRLAARFLDALQSMEGQLDRQANAVAIGFLKGGGAGVAGMSGTEVYYLRPDGPLQAHLRVSQVVGREARLSVAASTGAYVACFYGPREVLARPARRRGADAELFVASLGLLRLDANGKKACGWMAGVGAGLGLGIPILSNFSAFEFEEQPLGGVKLSSAQSKAIEAVIEAADDRSWRRRVAKAL